jgi:hypothetical protein
VPRDLARFLRGEQTQRLLQIFRPAR